MKRKSVTGIMLTLVLTSTLTLAFNIQQVKAFGNIHTRSGGNTEVNQTVAGSLQENLAETIRGGHQMLQLSSSSNSSSFSRHIMCKDHGLYWDGGVRVRAIDPTTIFRPSDTKAEVLTTISMDDRIEFRWHYRSNLSKTWVSCFNWSDSVSIPGEYYYWAWLNISGFWPAYNYPRAYKVDVHLDDLFSFSEFFEVTNGGLNSPRMCEDVDVDGHPVNMKSRFTIGNDTKAHHYLRFDKVAYFNEELGISHNFTTVWIQPDGSTYRTYLGSFPDYKDTDVTWNYWEFNYTPDDYISINPSTPIGNWTVEVYLDRYYFNNTWMPYGPVATTQFILEQVPRVSATVDINPDTMNLHSKGEWITCYIELPEGYSVSDIDIYSVKLNDTFPVSLLPNPPVPVPTEIGDYDDDGVPDLMVKFSRTEVASWVYNDLDIQYGNVTLSIIGELSGGTPFGGTDTVKVLFPGDADDDGAVTSHDLSIFAGCYGTSIENPSYDFRADFNEDGCINSEDLSIIAGYYGKTV